MPNRAQRRQRARERAARDQRKAEKRAARAGLTSTADHVTKVETVEQVTKVENVEQVETTPTPTVDARARQLAWKRERERRTLTPDQLAELERTRADRAAKYASESPEQRAERELRNVKRRDAKRRRKVHGLLTPQQRLEVQRENMVNALAARLVKRPSLSPAERDAGKRARKRERIRSQREAQQRAEREAQQRAVLTDSLQARFIAERGKPVTPIVMGAAVLRWQFDVARDPETHPPMHDSNGASEIARVYVDQDGVLTLCDHRSGEVLTRYQMPPKDKVAGFGPERLAMSLVEL